ncbi:MAG: hypothetical protein IPL79_05470 [Myxococcales bacterium]|nr:hypothetical protein [Myxococcales bacterium]
MLQGGVRVDVLRLVGSAQTNKVMEGELSRLATKALARRPPAAKRAGVGTLLYPFADDLAQLALGYHRTSARVLRDLFRLDAKRLEPLYDELRAEVEADDRAWWGSARTLSVGATRTTSFAAGERQIVGTVKNAIVDGLQARGHKLAIDAERPDLLLSARVDDDERLVVSLDLGGRSLSQRGYRAQAGEAPLREHLAASLVMLSRYDARREIFFDPMCGAGTICIEAALMATAAARMSGLPPLFPDTVPHIVGNELDVGVLASARNNAEQARARGIAWRCGDFRALAPADVIALTGAASGEVGNTGVIVVNPPYDDRMRDADIFGLYQDLGDWAAQFVGWRMAVIVDHPDFEQAFGHPWQQKKPLANGNLRSYFYLYAMA